MQLRAVIISMFGVFLAGASVFLANTLMSENSASGAAEARPAYVKVLSAKSDIPFGEAITREHLSAQDWPADNVPPGAFTSTGALLGPDGTSARRATQLIPAGDLILQKRVSDFGETVTIVRSLGENTRAMAIEVDAVTAVGGFVMPGDRVDIVLTEGRGASLRAATILQDIRVLGTDQVAEAEGVKSREVRTITVEVTARDGQILALGQRAGILSLTLRTRNNVADEELEQISLADLLKNAAPVEAAPAVIPTQAPAPRHRITVRRGTEENVVELQ